MVIVGKKIFAVSISVVSTSIFVRVVVNRGCQRGAVGTTYGYAETGIIIAVVYLGRVKCVCRNVNLEAYRNERTSI